MSRLSTFLAQLQGHAPEVCVEEGSRAYTYAQLLEEVERWRRRLEALNVEPGSVIAVRADYSFSAIAALLALLTRGAIAALIPRDRDAAQYVSDACASRVLEFSADGTYNVQSAPAPSRTHRLIDALRAVGQGGVVIFTSGSTGRPKAALHGVEGLLYKFQKPGRRFRTLAFLLLDHIAGLDTLFYALASGGALVLTRARDPKTIVGLIETHRVQVLPTSPSFLRMLCATVDSSRLDLSSLQIITYGSEPMDPSTLLRLNALFPNAKIIQKYGTTETGSPRCASRGNDSLWLKIKSDSVETKIVGGVLWIRSEGTILGYLNAPSPLDEEGWYCTGDLVDVDGEWIRFRGRTADLINVGGEKVAPAEVEQSILELDFVREVVVAGESHSLMGQIVTARVALVAPSEDPRQAIQRIRSHCRRRLASYKVPVKIEIASEGLVSERQKAQRRRSAD